MRVEWKVEKSVEKSVERKVCLMAVMKEKKTETLLADKWAEQRVAPMVV